MCYDHELRPLEEILGPDWEEKLLPVRCLPALGIHERCEHDPKHPPPSFKGMLVDPLAR